LKEALEQVVQLAREGNRYLNESAPWHSFKTDPAEAGQTLGVAAQIVGTIGIQLQPFLPITTTRIHRSLFLGKKPNWKLAGAISVKPGARIKPMQPLFHKVSAKNLRTRLEEIRSGTTTEAEA
jgi:methionyl-tRNA synthetase